ncbi:hypothetical protein [Mycobacterium spongiae]|uniref:Uncharacterized protein n=1 Tax=Mycobacterium spongiae TaxID=886343 RepID=A0A975PXS7_9MYCO|nr:hypothetical protein [Mycobacterium spongiae]QUR68500.1 hypothetical protein F6B93_16695 [Mycobacterium spongiae]
MKRLPDWIVVPLVAVLTGFGVLGAEAVFAQPPNGGDVAVTAVVAALDDADLQKRVPGLSGMGTTTGRTAIAVLEAEFPHCLYA